MPQSPNPASFSGLEVLKSFLGISFALIFLLTVVGAAHYYTEYRTKRLTTEASEALNVELSRQVIVSDFIAVVSDLQILAQQLEERAGKPGGLWQPPLTELSRLFGFFSANKGIYDQVRYLDESGEEVIRVNYVEEAAYLVPPSALQNKAHRSYFNNTIQLEHGGIYVSPMNLNIENGQLEQPIKPVMRFATPVFDSSGESRGIVVLNYLGERLIRHFEQATINIADHVQLINNDGYWLSSPDPADEWGFVLGEDRRFVLRFPDAWEAIQKGDSGQLLTPNGLFSFTTLHPAAVARRAVNPTLDPATIPVNAGNGEYHWKIVSRVPLEALTPLPGKFVQRHANLYSGILVLMLLLAWLLAYLHTRNQWAEAQTHYERHFRRTLENIQLAAVSVDQRGRLEFCNDYFCNLTGWQRKDILGRDWVETFVPKQLETVIRDMLEQLKIQEDFPARYETEILTRNGERKLINWNNTLSYNSKDDLYSITSIGEDITEKRHNEEQLRKLSRAMEQSPSIVVITDKDGNIEYVNPRFTEVSGYAASEVIGKNPRIMKSGETSPEEYRKLWQTILAGGQWRGVFHNRRKNGELYWESAAISAIRDTEGKITHFLSVKEDITHRKQLEDTIEERNRELAKNQALAAMGRMSSMIAHDLRNPLSSVKMGLQIFSKSVAANDEEASELCQIGLEQVRYMENILSDMLTFARPEALKLEWVKMERLLQSTLAMLQTRLDELGVKYRLECAPGLPAFPGDEDKLRQLFSNLIMNAAQAMQEIPPEEREIRIESRLCLESGGTFISTQVCDNGRGLDEGLREQLFDPFVTTRAKGTGLGLAIVRQIVEQHHGSAELTPQDPRGTCATVMLPTTPPEAIDITSDFPH